MAPTAERLMGIHRNILTIECVRMRSIFVHVAAVWRYRGDYKGYSQRLTADNVHADVSQIHVRGIGYVTAAVCGVDLGVGDCQSLIVKKTYGCTALCS